MATTLNGKTRPPSIFAKPIVRLELTVHFNELRLGLALATSVFSLIHSAPVSASPPGVAIYNVAPTPHFAAPGTSPDEIVTSLRHSAAIEHWTVTRVEPGLLTTQKWVREKHLAVVQIGFDDVYFWINYLDSENLNYRKNKRDLSAAALRGRRKKTIEGPFIHPNYNVWVKNLSSIILTRGITSNPDTSKGREQSFDVPLIADELRKLSSLREEGLLTQEEFEKQRKRLLSD